MANGWGGARPNSGPKRRRINGAPPVKKWTKPPPAKSAAEPKRWMPSFEDVQALVEQSRRYARNKTRTLDDSPFHIPEFPKHVVPPGGGMAMDNGIIQNNSWASNAWLAGAIFDGAGAEGLIFPGYAYLSQLAQVAEYRTISETIADDATRKWIDFEVTGDEDENLRRQQGDPAGEAERMADPDERAKRTKAAGKTDKIKELRDDQERLGVRDQFYAQSRNDGFFGRSHLFVQIGDAGIDGDPAELKHDIGDGRNDVSAGKIAKGSLKLIKTIEPIWAYPQTYNATNPLKPGWYDPQQWFVMGVEVHKSRFLPFIGHPVPDMLKPAYAFGGLSMSQMAKPYVDIWLGTRQNVYEMTKAFSVMVLLTDLATLLAPGGDLMTRVMLFNALRDNQGAFVANKETEDIKNVAAPLSGLDHLQAQAQEHMAAVSRIPLVKLTGISPSGLNATSEQEIEVYDDTIAAYQNRFFRPNLTALVNMQQLSLWGEIDPEITIVFEKLREATPKERADMQKADGERHQIYVDMGVISTEEVRKIVIDDPELPYTDLDPEDVPELKEEEMGGLIPEGAGKGLESVLEEGQGNAKPNSEQDA